MRSLQTQAGMCARAQWLLAAALLLSGAGFYLFGYRPMSNQLRDLRMQSDAKQRQLGMDQSRANTLPAVKLEVDALQLRLERFDKKLPRNLDLGQFIKDLTQISQQASLRKLLVQPGGSRRADLYSERPILLSFEGDFLSAYSFLRETETMQRLTRVRNLSIKSRDVKLGQVEVQMALSIYSAEG